MLMSAPRCNSKSTTRSWPCSAAAISAVLPLLVCWLISAPRRSSSSTARSWPHTAAPISSVMPLTPPLSYVASARPPLSSHASNAASSPRSAAATTSSETSTPPFDACSAASTGRNLSGRTRTLSPLPSSATAYRPPRPRRARCRRTRSSPSAPHTTVELVATRQRWAERGPPTASMCMCGCEIDVLLSCLNVEAILIYSHVHVSVCERRVCNRTVHKSVNNCPNNAAPTLKRVGFPAPSSQA